MGDANPFAPSGSTAFLSSLAKSTIDTFRDEHENDEKERKRAQGIDYELLMAGLKQLEPDLTPTQAKEIMTRAVDIFKPKGHGGIKDKLAEMFGHGHPYEMQSARILRDVSSQPRAVTSTPAPVTPPDGGGGTRLRTVTMPPPPIMQREKTYREQGLADDQTKVGFQLDKALAVEEARAANRKADIKTRNDEVLKRHMQETGQKDEAKALLPLKQRAALFGDPNDPDTLERARVSLQSELADKRDLSKSRIELNRRRLTEIDDKLKVAWARVDVAKQNAATHAQSVKFKDDPQWKGMWSKASSDAQAAKLLRTQAAIAHSKFQTEGDEALLKQATDLEGQAETFEADMAKQLSGLEDREYTMSGGTKMGGVTLPDNPASKGRQRPWSASKWAAANPSGDVERAKTAAAARGDRVVP